jgi:glyoxylase-like metal-dependent hydrolase (beta-lactamase superfamily II)
MIESAAINLIGGIMSQRKMLVFIVCVVFLATVPLMALAQAQGQQPPADGRGGRGEGRGGRGGDGQAAPRGEGRGGDARGGQGGRGGAAQQGQAIKQIKPGVYLVTGAGGNATVRVTEQGVMLVDTKNLGDPFYNDLVAQIKTVTPQPVKYVFVTHVHQDHSGNIERFEKAGAQVIAYEGLNRNLHEGGPNGKGYEAQQGKPADANMPYKKNKKVKLGKAEAVAYHFDNGHTSGDTVVYFPDVKLVALGDEFTGTGPNCDYPMGGSILGWSRSLAQVLKLDFDMAIPGHSAAGNTDPLTKADVATFQKRMDAIGKKGIELAKAGTPKDQIRQQIQMQLGAEMGMWNMTQVVNDMRLDAFYDEMMKAAKGGK